MEYPKTTKNVGQPCVICGQAADAQATIAALQAKLEDLTAKYQNLVAWYDKQNGTPCEQVRHRQEVEALQAQLNEQNEKLKYHDLFKKWQCWRDPDELVDEYEKWQAAIREHQSLKEQLTQRTAERDTARRRVDELEAREVDVVLLRDDLEQRTAELEAANKLLYKKNCELGRFETIISDLQAELERVRGERDDMQRAAQGMSNDLTGIGQKYDELRTLIAALPKVEVVTGDTVVNIVQQYNFHQWMLRALQHRQGMEE